MYVCLFSLTLQDGIEFMFSFCKCWGKKAVAPKPVPLKYQVSCLHLHVGSVMKGLDDKNEDLDDDADDKLYDIGH